MIFGHCPYCDEPICLPMPVKTPVFSRETCEACGKTFWEHYSRVEPEGFTDEAFAERFIVDDATKQITERQH